MVRPEPDQQTAEHHRIAQERERVVRWKHWGPYVADRAWGTVREDYSKDGDAWGYFPHDHARSRAYRWNEDGLFGICDRNQTLCLALAFWNGADPILKERLFGVSGPEGNHGEDVKELYWHEDATPTASYLRARYAYPQRAFPYEELVTQSGRRGTRDRELELADLGAFEDNRWFDITIEYAKDDPTDIVLVVTVENRAATPAPLHILPHLWFRNTWSWSSVTPVRGEASALASGSDHGAIRAVHPELGDLFLYVDGAPELLFTENETNTRRLFGSANRTPYVKDAFHRYVVGGEKDAVDPARRGSKAAAWARFVVPGRGKVQLRARLSAEPLDDPLTRALEIVAARRAEADAFYAVVQGSNLSDDRRLIHRRATAGLLWSLQFYQYDVDRWLRGDAVPPPSERLTGRNHTWRHVSVADVISMPDKWEYPWFAAWDLAFHTLALASVDIDQAKAQLKLMVKEWYQHPNGQIPAYEWELSDLNPPVHAWATYQIFKIERRQRGVGDRVFLERVFHKLLINFAWWVNKRDAEGNNVFEGGFLGLDNISLFDRSAPLPPGVQLEQADATAWMAMYCLDLMRIALELATTNSAYEDLASKFFEHFLRIAYALHHGDDGGLAPWDEDRGFYFDILTENGRPRHLEVRSAVGLMPICAVHVITPDVYRRLDNFRRRTEWFLGRHPELAESITERSDGRRVLSAVPPGRLERVLAHLFDESKFLSPYGPRSLSKEHLAHPVVLQQNGQRFEVGYEPGESVTRMKGGNSNWRGPVWFPTGYLLYRSLLRLDHGFGDTVTIPSVAGGRPRTLREGAAEIARRMIALFEKDARGRRPALGDAEPFRSDPGLADRLLLFEYFHGDTGEGLGASHQTGWTALVADMILRLARDERGSG